MNDHRFSDDRIFSVQAQVAFPIEVRLSGSIGGNVAEVAGVVIKIRRTAMMFHRRIEMRAGRSCVRRRAIAFFMDMKTVLARCQILNVSHHFHFVANFAERNRAGDFTAGFRLK